MAGGATPAEETRLELDVHLGNEGKVGVRVPDDGGLHPAAPEHGRTVHCCAITVRPM